MRRLVTCPTWWVILRKVIPWTKGVARTKETSAVLIPMIGNVPDVKEERWEGWDED